ncbi:uncharacterized protein [Clytia hemisphaerica]|uniref:uncharacterized protein n=2 Tax=Clytia hemisphaerica TaxID=252671 RepID=UPI0034D59B7B
MVELLLNVIYACRAGLWDLLLECIREIIPYAFAYDNINYARYLSVMLGDMLALEHDFPEIYEQFILGNFTAQISDGVFSRVETDKVIEMTLNKDTKTPGGTTGFSTNIGAVHRWELNATYRASLREVFHQHLNFTSQKHKHKDLSPARIKKDEAAVQSIISILEETFVHPFAEMPLLSISRGIALDEATADKMLSVKEIGKELMITFNKERLEEGHTLSIFDRMKKQKLPTFSNIAMSKAAKHKARLVAIESTKELFAKIAIIAQSRVIDLKQLLSFPLIELPLSLSEPDGTLKKTAKSRLLHAVEGETTPVEMLQGDHAFVVDGMAYVRQLKSGGLTFDQFSTKLLKSIVSATPSASRIDVVFDVYFETSIKDVERQRRSTGEMTVKQIVSSAPIKQWGQLLSSGEFKNKLITYFLNDWKSKRHLLGDKILYVNDSTETWKLTKQHMEICDRLRSNQEEADTRMILHTKDAASNHEKVIIATPDTDVFIIAASNLNALRCNLFMLTGTGDNRRLIDLNLACKNYYSQINKPDYTQEMFLKALPGFHCFTGCDSISAFAGRGKIKPLKILIQKKEYVEAFGELGMSWNISEETQSVLESFVCHMYGKKDALKLGISVNDLRYDIYCRKSGKVSCEGLPPCLNVLSQHIKRANYQAKIWRMCLNPLVERCDPSEHGWGIDDGGLFVKWMTCNPALDEVLSLVTCDCKKSCGATCPCVMNKMECSDACGCGDCGNRDEDDQESEDFESDEESDLEEN